MTAAIIVAGGRATRLGGIDKPALVVDGRSLLDRALDAVAHCERIVVVGHETDRAEVVWEEPRFAGPAAATLAGLAALADRPDAEDVLLLAADLPRIESLVARLPEVPADADGVVAHDVTGHQQWLAGRYRIGALRAAAHEVISANGVSMRALLATMNLAVAEVGDAAIDLDTWDDVEAFTNNRNRETP